jgi:hypothetical protein
MRSFARFLSAAMLLAPAGRARGQDSPLPPPRVRFTVLPALSSAPETGLAFGAAMLVVTRDPNDTVSRPTRHQFFAIATAKKQWRIAGETDAWFDHDAWRLNARVEYRVYPLTYYGTGIDAPASSADAFTPRGLLGFALAQRRILAGVYLIGGLRFWDQRITSDAGGLLASSGAPGSTGSRVLFWQGGVALDTRDDVLLPSRGELLEVTSGISSRSAGSDFTYSRVMIDARAFRTLHPRVVLAAQALAQATSGTPPFDQLPMIGASDYMRGYTLGRYRDRHLLALQGELRLLATSRLSLVGFAGAGTVAPSLADLSQVRWLPTIGGGGRVRVFKGSNASVRADVAIGKGAKGFYLAFNEAF